MYYELIPDDYKFYVPQPTNDSVIGDYLFSIIDEIEGLAGVHWTARIERNGKAICEVENTGNGGSNYYHVKDKALYEQMVRDADIVYPNEAEPLDAFVQFLDVLCGVAEVA